MTDEPMTDTTNPPATAPATVTTVTNDAPSARQGETWGETVKTIVYALLIAVVIRSLFFQPFNIPSGSMENTLLIGDYLFVEKFAYGYSRYSFPFGLAPIPGRIFGRVPGSLATSSSSNLPEGQFRPITSSGSCLAFPATASR